MLRSFAGFEISDSEVIDSGLFLGVYGIGGTGKTTMLSEVVLSPYGTPALLVDIDGSAGSVIHLKKHGLDIVTPKDWNDFKKIHDAFKKNSQEYKSYILNNISWLTKWCMKAVTTLEQPQIQHYGLVQARITEVLQDCSLLARLDNVNTLVLLWEETEEDKLTGIVRKKVNLYNKLSAEVPGITPMMARLTVVGDASNNYVRKISFAPSIDTDAKYNVAPTDAAANIPLELYWRRENHFMVDFLDTLKGGKPFPVEKYAKPKRPGQN